MNKLILFCLLIIISSTVYCQDFNDRENRSGKLFFKVGADYRITPIYKSGLERENTLSTNSDLQSSGAAFFYTFEFFPWKNVSFNFSQSFHYTLFSYKSALDFNSDSGAEEASHSLFLDYHIYLNYYVKLTEKSELFARVGRSLLNRNSNYSDKESFFDGDEFIGSITSQQSFRFQSYNFGLGYKNKKVELMLGLYFAEETPYFAESAIYLIPYFNLAYNLGKM